MPALNFWFRPNVTDLCLGAILADLVEHREDLVKHIKIKHPDQKITFTALVRKAEHIDIIGKLEGVVAIQGEFSDVGLIAKHARTADITINAAGSDNVELTEAILAGQKARVVEDKKERAALLHTSGVAVFAGKERDGRDPTKEGTKKGTKEGTKEGTEEGTEKGTEKGTEEGTKEGAEEGTEEVHVWNVRYQHH